MAKITSLNDDVLLEIFENAVQESDGRPLDNYAPLNISRTCQHWREVVLANGCLWTRFSFEKTGTSDEKGEENGYYEMRSEIARLWIERSRDAVLSLDFDWVSISASLIRTIFDHQSRLGKLVIREVRSEDGKPHTRPQVKVMIRDLSNLVELLLLGGIILAIDTSLLLETEGSPSSSCAHPIAPKLRKLSVESRNYEIDATTTDLLEQCPNLEEFVFSNAYEHKASGRALRRLRPMTFANLKTLDLNLKNCSRITDWLRHSTAPSLQSLHIGALDDAWSIAATAEFLERSRHGAPVEVADLSINIRAEDIPDADAIIIIMRLFRALPGLKEYKCYDFPSSARGYELLTTESGSGDFWPHLEKFQAYYNPSIMEASTSNDAIVNFLSSRLSRLQPFLAKIGIPSDTHRDHPLTLREEISRWKTPTCKHYKYLAWANYSCGYV